MTVGRVAIFLRRFLRARAFGVPFTGATRLRMPESMRLCNRVLKLSLPEEAGQEGVFLYLGLDDVFGLRELPFQPKTILDVGANLGLFSLLAAHYCPMATIHAYEPNPYIFSYTSANLALVGGTAFHAGVGSRPGLAVIRGQGESRLAQTVRSETGTVPIVSLSEAVRRFGMDVDLLKLNCEGAEWEIFEDVGAFPKIRLIRMEYHLTGGRNLDHLIAHAKHLGFNLDRLTPRNDSGYAWLSRQE